MKWINTQKLICKLFIFCISDGEPRSSTGLLGNRKQAGETRHGRRYDQQPTPRRRRDHLRGQGCSRLRSAGGGGDGALRVLRRGRGLHGVVHPRRARVLLRRLAVRAVRGGREGARAPRPGRRRGGGAGRPRGGVQGLQRYHEAEPDAVPGRVHAPHRAQEPGTADGVVPGARQRAGVQGGGAREVRQLQPVVHGRRDGRSFPGPAQMIDRAHGRG